MKKIILATSLILATSTAYAADAVVYNEPAPVVADTFSWTGGYIGLNAGYAGGKFKHPVTITEGTSGGGGDGGNGGNGGQGDRIGNTGGEGPLNRGPSIQALAAGDELGSASVDVTASGFIGGIQAGYNWQFDRTVVGIETDIQGSGLKGEVSAQINDFIGVEAGTKIKWFGTTRVRLGYLPTERFMVYATGGIAYGKVETYASLDGLGGFSASKNKVGYTVGAGAEYAITNNWTLKSEYLYTDLGKMKFSLGENPIANIETKSAFHTVRVGVNYKF